MKRKRGVVRLGVAATTWFGLCVFAACAGENPIPEEERIGTVEQAVGQWCGDDDDCTPEFCCGTGVLKKCGKCCDNGDCTGLDTCHQSCCSDLYYLKGCCGTSAPFYNHTTGQCYSTLGTCIWWCIME
jgi:hypothetical protein